MNKKAISYTEFLSYLEEERLVLTTGIKDNWDAQRHIDYIVELQNNGNADNVQFLLSYIGKLDISVEVIISLQSKSIIQFRIKTIDEKEREYLMEHWREVMDEIILKVEDDKPSEDSYIERMLQRLKQYDPDAVETLEKRHNHYKSMR